MKFIRTFHPIGQGAFYTEQHIEGEKTLTIVYDCGSSPGPTRHFLQKVATALPWQQPIDILFISHFHADHINGLDELKKCHPIRVVVLPKLTEEARILVKLENFVEYKKFSSLLVDNPRAYFGDETLIIQVEPIREKGEAGADATDNGPFIDFSPDEPPAPSPSLNVPSQNRTWNIPSGTPLRLNTAGIKFWEYLPFNYEFAPRRSEFLKLLAEFNIALNSLESLENIIAQKRVIAEVYGKLDGDLNENSLVVYSGASRSVGRVHHSRADFTDWPFYYDSPDAGCLYTGDADLNANFIVADIQQRLQSRWPKIYTFQIPHHGAIRNFNSALIDTSTLWGKPEMMTVISYGTTNSYGHPSCYVVGQLHLLNTTPVLVDERLHTALFSYADYSL